MQPGPEVAIFALRVLIVACLYLFLLWVALAARRGVEVRSSSRVQPRRLVVVDAPPGMVPGVALAIQPSTTIGRANDNAIVVPDVVVSAHHAALVSRGDGTWLEDLGSTNGTLLNGQWIGAPVRVGVGDEITIGPARFKLEA